MPAIRSNSASKPSASIQRVYSDVILPIKPHFVELMLAGKKNHEYRKYKLRDTVVRLWLYEVSPASRIRYVLATPEQLFQTADMVNSQICHAHSETQDTRRSERPLRHWQRRL